jgi:hypothetical protein
MRALAASRMLRRAAGQSSSMPPARVWMMGKSSSRREPRRVMPGSMRRKTLDLRKSEPVM